MAAFSPNGCATTYTVLLLDEVEGIDVPPEPVPAGVLTRGWLTDGRGKKVFIPDAIIIMTSNLGNDSFRST
ncbi:MAG: hypothetical protein IPF82_00005 [Blastocatellia bacterium]|nr:hypothetical protein [Blastocatellia bacterium]